MSEMLAVDEVRADFSERNTALFLFLGLLSGLSALRRFLEAETGAGMGAAADAMRPASPFGGDGAPPKFHLFVLGLVAFGDEVKTFAHRGGRDVTPSEPPQPWVFPADLLR